MRRFLIEASIALAAFLITAGIGWQFFVRPPADTYSGPEGGLIPCATNHVDRGGRVCRAGGRSGPTGAFFEFAPASGAGLPYAQDICSYASGAGLLTGQYWCTRGDGAALAGAPIQVATASGSPVSTTQRICPNGPDCVAMNMTRIPDAVSGYMESANVDRSASVTTGSWTDCVHVVFNPVGVIALTSLYSNTVGAFSHSIQVLATGAIRSNGSSGACPGVPVNVDAAAVLVAGQPAVICQSWAASDGFYRLYVNGVADGVSASATTTCGGGAGSRWVVGGIWNAGAVSNAFRGGGVLGAVHTDTQLSAGQITALTNAVLARNPTGAKGEVLTDTHTGSYYCESSTVGAGSIVPANVACIHNNGYSYRAAGAWTNSVQFYNALATAPWTTSAIVLAVPTVTNADTTAPGGTGINDMTRIQNVACPTVGNNTLVIQNYTGTAATWTAQVHLRGRSGSGNVALELFDTTTATGTMTNCPYTTTPSVCTVSNTFANTTHSIRIGCEHLATVTGNTDTGAADVLVWGAQSEVGTVAHPVAPTTNAAAGPGAETLTTPWSQSLATGCASVSFIPPTTGAQAGSNGGGYVIADVGNNRYLTRSATAKDKITAYNGTVAIDSAAVVGYVANTPIRLASSWDGTNVSLYWPTAQSNTAAWTSPSNPTTLYIGGNSSSGGADGDIGRVQLDPSTTKCVRP